MSSKRLSLFFETTEGHTKAVAERIRVRLEQAGHEVRMSRCRDASPGDIDWADICIVGGSIHAGNHHSKVIGFAQRYAAALSGKPLAFFLVCLTASSPKPEAPGVVSEYLEAFALKTGCKPAISRAFAGALLYTQYGFVKRKIMEGISRKEGGETDTSRDHIYTDWKAVEDFADEVAILSYS
jgi:menaquinone-dependent protoporphyrinogen oxidase